MIYILLFKMGIDGLTKFLKSKAPKCIHTITYDDLGKPGIIPVVYAVDVSSYLFASQYNKINKSIGNHIREFFEMIACAHQHNYFLVFVFDGDTHGEAKAETIGERTNNRERQRTKIKTLMSELQIDISGDEEQILINRCYEYINNPEHFTPKCLELRDVLKNYIVLQASHFSDLKTLFDLSGQPYLQAIGEADHMIATLAKEGLIDGVFSEDLDMLTHGIPALIRGVTTGRSTGILSLFKLTDILAELKLTMTQFVELCILCGCDYAPTITGIGPVKGHALLLKYGSINNIIKELDNASEAFRKKYPIALEQFLATHEVLPDTVLYWQKPTSELQSWLISKTNYTEHTVKRKMTFLPKEEIMRPPLLSEKIKDPEVPKIRVRVTPKYNT